MSESNPLLILSHNGDPYGRGFVAPEHRGINADGSVDDRYGIYRGDVGAQTREWWRHYARRNGYTLREVR